MQYGFNECRDGDPFELCVVQYKATGGYVDKYLN